MLKGKFDDASTNTLLKMIYNEKDFATLISISVASLLGLIAYIFWGDAFAASMIIIMIFPIPKVLLTGYSKRWNFFHEKYQKEIELEDTYGSLGFEELKAVRYFVDHGGSTIGFNESRTIPEFTEKGIDSLINRGLIELTDNSGCSRAGYCLNEGLFKLAIYKSSK